MTERIPATYHQKEAKAMYVEEPEKQRANGPPILGGPFALCFSGIRSFSSGERRLRRRSAHIQGTVLRRGESHRRRARKIPLSAGVGTLTGAGHPIRRATLISRQSADFLKYPSIVRLHPQPLCNSRHVRCIGRQQLPFFVGNPCRQIDLARFTAQVCQDEHLFCVRFA